MPLYAYRCPAGHDFDRFLKLKDYDQAQTCECGQPATKRIMPTAVQVDIPAYISPGTGKLVSSRTQRREDLKESGCVEYEPSMRQEQEKRHAAEDAALDKKVEEHVEREILSMPTRKREQLAAEVEALDVDIVRA